jgi:hypothetical protein
MALLAALRNTNCFLIVFRLTPIPSLIFNFLLSAGFLWGNTLYQVLLLVLTLVNFDLNATVILMKRYQKFNFIINSNNLYNKCVVAKLGDAAASILLQILELQGFLER